MNTSRTRRFMCPAAVAAAALLLAGCATPSRRGGRGADPGSIGARVSDLVTRVVKRAEQERAGVPLHIEAKPRVQQIFLFDTEPEDADIRFNVRISGDDAPQVIHIAGRNTAPAGTAFDLTAKDAFGIPDGFGENRESRRAGVHVWWLPGKEMEKAHEASRLTPEERARLKALGYIQ